MEHTIKQNNAINIYEDYFPSSSDDTLIEPHTARTATVFRYGMAWYGIAIFHRTEFILAC